MSNIPNAAITTALMPIQQRTQQAGQARQTQLQKNFRHAQNVEELDDTGVDSIHDGQSHGKGGDEPREKPHDPHAERIEIEGLPPLSNPPPAAGPQEAHLDISA